MVANMSRQYLVQYHYSHQERHNGAGTICNSGGGHFDPVALLNGTQFVPRQHPHVGWQQVTQTVRHHVRSDTGRYNDKAEVYLLQVIALHDPGKVLSARGDRARRTKSEAERILSSYGDLALIDCSDHPDAAWAQFRPRIAID